MTIGLYLEHPLQMPTPMQGGMETVLTLLHCLPSGHTDVMMENVHTRLEGLCQGQSEPSVSIGDAVAAAARLGSKRLLLADPASKRLYMRVSLNVPVDDLSHVLKHEETISWLKDLSF